VAAHTSPHRPGEGPRHPEIPSRDVAAALLSVDVDDGGVSVSDAAVGTEPAYGHTVAMDAAGRIRIPRGGARTAALLRIGLGLVYLWAFISQGFGVTYTNVPADAQPPPANSAAPAEVEYRWSFGYDADKGWISSGFSHSPTEGYIEKNVHGPVGEVLEALPTGVTDFGWMFALAGLGIALTFGLFSRIAGWGGLILNLMIWFAAFPPSSNPLIDAEHMAFGLAILLLMWIQASNHWGLGRWWRARVPYWLE
jgi:thiosulfate dehydrogenase [quinone] large subunit